MISVAVGQYGEDSTSLGQFVDEFTDLNNVSVTVDVVRNTTYNSIELNGTTGIPTLENYTTYTEIDEDGDITVTDYTITFDTMRRDAISRVQFDYGANFFDEFQHELDVNMTDIEAGDASDRSSPMVWAVANSLGPWVGDVQNSDSIAVWINQVGATDDQYQFHITWFEAGALQDQVIGIVRNVNEEVYLVMNRTDDDFFLAVYSDSSRSTLNETLTILNVANTQFRYLYGLLNVGSANDPADHASGVLSDLWFGNETGGFVSSGYLTTEDYLDQVNGSTLVLQTISKIPASGGITVEFSSDNATWINQTALVDGLFSIDLRSLNWSGSTYLNYSLTTSDSSETPSLNQSRLITTEGAAAAGAGVNVSSVWTYYDPSEIGVTTGTLDSGGLANVTTVDGTRMNVSEVVGVPGMDISFNFTLIPDDAACVWLVLNCYYDGTATHVFDIDLYNETGGSWETIGLIPDQTGFEWVNSTIYDLRIPNDYVTATGAVRGRLYHVSAGNINHDLSIEFLNIYAEIPSTVTPVAGDVDIGPWIAIAIILSIIAYLLARSR
jgi:hypothetical protein